jgi:hypothetical protein
VIIDGQHGPYLVLPARVVALIRPAAGDVLAKARRNGVRLPTDVVAALAEIHEVADRWLAAVAAAGPRQPAATPPPSPLMDTNDLADHFGLSTNRIRQKLRAGEIPGRRDEHGRWRVDRAALTGARER